MLPVLPPALLALADGTVFQGISIGAAGHTVGEVVFNTALTGYQEILTDPSYCRQIVTLTYPHIGSYGVNEEDVEATKIHAAGLIIKDLPVRMSNFRATSTLDAYLQREGTVAIAGIDTRRLTRVLRTKGAQNGCITSFAAGHAISQADIDAAITRALGAPSMAGQDLARVVSVTEPYAWTETEWALGGGHGTLTDARFHVVAYDFGVKRNILRMLASRGCRITVVPAQTSAEAAMALRPDGIFLSNGPGDPEPCDYAIAAIRQILDTRLPVFGICLGHQLLAVDREVALLAQRLLVRVLEARHHLRRNPRRQQLAVVIQRMQVIAGARAPTRARLEVEQPAVALEGVHLAEQVVQQFGVGGVALHVQQALADLLQALAGFLDELVEQVGRVHAAAPATVLPAARSDWAASPISRAAVSVSSAARAGFTR